jgi:hypothetical protein
VPIDTEEIVADTGVGVFEWLVSWLRAEAWIGDTLDKQVLKREDRVADGQGKNPWSFI